ncbi:MAG: AtpZ/AtpI family protein [Acidimicrobiales bacterium]
MDEIAAQEAGCPVADAACAEEIDHATADDHANGSAASPADSDRSLMDSARGALYRGYGEGLSWAFELAVTPVLLAGGGYLLDRWLGLFPVVTIIFFLVGSAGLFARLWYGHEARMQALDAEAPWAARPPARAVAGSVVGEDPPTAGAGPAGTRRRS